MASVKSRIAGRRGRAEAPVMGLRAFAERNVRPCQIEALADDMADMLDVYRVQ
jgi:hypothetical protein